MTTTFTEREARVTELRSSVASGDIARAGRVVIEKYNVWICDPLIRGAFSGDAEYEQICQLARLHLNRVMMDEAERRNVIMQWCVVGLTVASILGTLLQTWYAYRADQRAVVAEQPVSATPDLARPSSASALPVVQAVPKVSSAANIGVASGPKK